MTTSAVIDWRWNTQPARMDVGADTNSGGPDSSAPHRIDEPIDHFLKGIDVRG